MLDMQKIFGKTPRILVVDDDPGSATLLSKLLESCGAKTKIAHNGGDAVAAASRWHADLILLDVLLPDLDGFEVCRKIRCLQEGYPLPIVMVTALSGKDDRLKGLESGADDFITKPYGKSEVVTRVRSLLRIKFLFDEVTSKNNELDEKNKLLETKNNELIELQKLKENLVHMIVHDLKNPLTGIQLDLEMLQMCGISQVPEKALQRLRRIDHEATRIQGMLLDLLDISRIEDGRLKLTTTSSDLLRLVKEKLERFTTTFSRKLDDLSFRAEVDQILVDIDRRMMERVLDNLLHNAVKFSQGKARILVTLGIDGDGRAQLTVTDNGPGIPPDKLDLIFDKFYRIQNASTGGRSGSGLGLNFCKLAVESHGGGIRAQSDGRQGTSFILTLPQTRIPQQFHAASA